MQWSLTGDSETTIRSTSQTTAILERRTLYFFIPIKEKYRKKKKNTKVW